MPSISDACLQPYQILQVCVLLLYIIDLMAVLTVFTESGRMAVQCYVKANIGVMCRGCSSPGCCGQPFCMQTRCTFSTT